MMAQPLDHNPLPRLGAFRVGGSASKKIRGHALARIPADPAGIAGLGFG
jgi:hypothetical protein